MGLRISFDGPREGFSEISPSGLQDTSWSARFWQEKADVFLVEHGLQYLPEHAAFDFLIACRNSLKIGARLRIAETDWNNPNVLYQRNALAVNPRIRFDVTLLTKFLLTVGFSSTPVEFYDEAGHLHLLEESNFYKFGHIRRSNRFDPRANDPSYHFSSLIIDGIKTSESRDRQIYNDVVHVIGDSHARFVAGKDNVKGGEDGIGRIYKGFCAKFIAYHVGPGLVFNLDKYGSKTGALEKIEKLLESGMIAKNARVMFSFGEIDCRFHVCRQAESQNRTIDEVVMDLCGTYIRFLDNVHERGYQPMVWAPFSTTWIDHWGDDDNPIYGSYSNRYGAVSTFNKIMADLCCQRLYGFASLFHVVNDKHGSPIRSYFCDPLHLSQSARKFIHSMAPKGEFINDLMAPTP